MNLIELALMNETTFGKTMIRLVNHNSKKIISCPFGNGTTFLHLYAIKFDDYEHMRGIWEIPNDYIMYKVVRDPIRRFYSWYNKFMVLNAEWFNGKGNRFIKEKLNENNVDWWFEHIRTSMHYDNHLCLQKYAHFADERFNIENTQYIDSSHLQKFLGLKDHNYPRTDYTIPCQEKSDKYLYKFYEQDIEWINNLKVIK